MFIRVEERVPLVYEPDLVENLGLLLEVKVNLDALTDLIVPEDDAVDPFVADPTLIRLICQHVPLAASWDVNLVADPTLEDQLLVIVSDQFIAGAVSIEALRIEV